MRIKFRIKGYERIIAAKRTLQVLLSDYTDEMQLFLAMSKGAVKMRIWNDGQEYDPDISSFSRLLAKVGYRTYKYTIRTMRRVYEVGSGYRRKSKLVVWRPLARQTIYNRIVENFEYPDFPRLYKNGKLLKSLISDGYGHWERVTRLSFHMGAYNRIAALHEYGGGKIPARPYYFISDDLLFTFRKIISLKINSAFRMLRSVAKY